MRRAARLLVPLGALAIVVVAGAVHRHYRGAYEASRWTVALIVLLGFSAYAAGLPDLVRTARAAAAASAAASMAAGIAVSLVQLAVGSQVLPRFVVLLSVVAFVPWCSACAVVARGGRKQERFGTRVVLVAGPEEEAALARELTRAPEHDAALVRVCRHADARPDRRGAEPLVDLAIDADATMVVLDRAASGDPSIVSQAGTLHEAGLRVRTLALFYEDWLGKLPLSELERLSLLFDIRELHRARYGRAKRLVDIGVGLVGCVVLVPTMGLVLIANLIANRGPLLYRQPRIGRDRAVFTIYKLRSMRPGTGPSTWTGDRDPRITPVGALLRRTHIDELPQAWNMLRGDLSLIGPRPEQPVYVEQLAEKLPWYHVRHLVRPGLTGWAQVKYAYGATEEDAMEKLQYELYYLRHQSLGLDARIVGRTLRHVVGLGGR